ncbi:MAG: hypothetical protein KDB82_16700 [Planctomycetes bacterium]|nr:hypothetical protein [Planctomycetota bacterium]
MRGRIKSGQLVTVEPLDGRTPTVGEAVLCKVRGCVYVHLVKGVRGDEFLIGNNIGGINGWTRQLAGIVVRVEE